MRRTLQILALIFIGIAVVIVDEAGVYWLTEAYGAGLLILAVWLTRNDWGS